VLACIGLMIVGGPFILLVALLVRLSSRGPATYRQTRLGMGSRPFTIFKLRSMVHDCEALSGPVWATPNDPRITPLGYWLRKLHLDEFPQLWNVLIGEMSLVGPRPERPEIIETLDREIPNYRARLAVLPGITGLAQLHVPADTNIEITRRKQSFDLHYLQHMSWTLDLCILLDTLAGVFGIAPWLTSKHAAEVRCMPESPCAPPAVSLHPPTDDVLAA
jgi:lipopolysaccharide/colanic/teichoic acid biosynthesis glycosyltransferase